MERETAPGGASTPLLRGPRPSDSPEDSDTHGNHPPTAGPMMGARLVAQVFTHWTHLPDRPFRILVRMAHVAKDTNPTPTYWGGRNDLAEALGLPPGEAAYQSVKRAVRHIVRAGAVEIAYLGHATKRTEYRLTLDRMPREKGVTERTPRGSVSDPLRGSVGDPHRGSLSDPAGGHSVTPQGDTEGETEEHIEETHLENLSVTKTTRRGRSKADEKRLELVRQRADREAAS